MLASAVANFLDNSSHGEDSFLIRDLGGGQFLDAVMDGVTGHGGAEASKSLVEALTSADITSPDDIVKVLEELNDEFFQVGGGRFLLTTVSAALFLDGQMYILSAGDSPVYIMNGDSVQQLTGRIGGFLHVGVAKAVGAASDLANLVKMDFAVEPGTRLVLATDGVSDNVQTNELAEMVRGASGPEDASHLVNSTIESRLEVGQIPEQLGRRFRHDDRTAIFRFFE
jgi:serine/threonine protein phosphatase PrpC